MIQKFNAHIRNRMPGAEVEILASLLSVDGTLQGALALAIAGSVEIFVGCQTVADGVHNGSFPDGIDTNQIRDHPKGNALILEIVPIDESKTCQLNHQPAPPSRN